MTVNAAFYRLPTRRAVAGGNDPRLRLEEWRNRIVEWRRRVDLYGFFDNDRHGFAVAKRPLPEKSAAGVALDP